MDEERNSQNRIKRAARASAIRRKSSAEFTPHPAYPKINTAEAETSRRPRNRSRWVRFASTASIGAGSRVSRGFGISGLTIARIISFAGLVAALWVGYWLLTSPNFRISNVEVQGGRFLSSNEVIAATAITDQNIFLLNEADMAERVKKLSYVLDARVSRSFPNSVTVEVTERHSMLNWQVGSTNYLVDNDGIVLESFVQLPNNAAKFTVVKSLDDKPLKIGDKVDPVAVRSGPRIAQMLEQVGFGTTSLDYSPSTGLIAMGIKEQGSRRVLIGTDAELTRKINVLKSLMLDQNLKWTFADLRFVDKPAVQ